MAERTIAQVATEIDQVRAKITAAMATVEAQRSKLTDLVREMAQMQTEALGAFGMRLVLENARDGHPVEAATPRRRARTEPTSPSSAISRADRQRNTAAREWGMRTRWKDAQGREVKAKGKMPDGLMEAFERAEGQTSIPT